MQQLASACAGKVATDFPKRTCANARIQSASRFKPSVMRSGVRRFMEQPLTIVLGMLTGAGAAKAGHGEWAAGGIVALVAIYAGAAATAMATRSLAAWVVRMRRREVLVRAARTQRSVARQSAIAAIAGITLSAASWPWASASAQEGQRIRIRLGEQTVTATLNNSEAARDLVAMLPLSIHMRDHLRREKTGPISGPLSERTVESRAYESGDLGYWRPGGNFVIFYRHDGLTIPSPGIVLLGKVESGAGIFDVPGTVDVAVELIN
jgi:hypothetical protein